MKDKGMKKCILIEILRGRGLDSSGSGHGHITRYFEDEN